MKIAITALTVILPYLFCTEAHANMGALLIIPKDPEPVLSLQLGGMSNSTDIERSSTNIALDTGSHTITESAPFLGGAIGLQNSYYRLSISYDYSGGSNLDLERFLLNFDFKFGDDDQFKWIVGTGVGVAESSYDMGQRSLKQSSGILCFRGGTEYTINKKSSLELVFEYSFTLGTGSTKSYYEASEFTSYQIEDQDGVILRLGYNFWF